jgi:hypothetical protein
MEKIGLVWNIQGPKDLPVRAELIPFRKYSSAIER